MLGPDTRFQDLTWRTRLHHEKLQICVRHCRVGEPDVQGDDELTTCTMPVT